MVISVIKFCADIVQNIFDDILTIFEVHAVNFLTLLKLKKIFLTSESSF